jgi:hypothetical protein
MRKKSVLLYGVGFNDVDYRVYRTANIDGKYKNIWICPYYRKWADLLKRCFCEKLQQNRPTYKGCSLFEDWLYFSNFIKWVDNQPNKDWQNCDLDKDLLLQNNKFYSPENCVFVGSKVNSFILKKTDGGHYLTGVYWNIKNNKFLAQCTDPFGLNGRYIGLFDSELEAHKAWQAKKHEYACQLADLQEDPRVAKALRERYAPDKDWTKR